MKAQERALHFIVNLVAFALAMVAFRIVFMGRA